MDDTPARPAERSICAPYGMIPWIRQENVSRMLATFLGSSPNRFEMSCAIPPTVMMAIVLLAVHRLASDTRAAMLISAPRLLLM